MNEMQTFSNIEIGTLQGMFVDGEPYFVGKDVTDILEYKNTSKALTDHVAEEDKLYNDSLSSLGQRGGWLINESGLYSLILTSKKPVAKKFKRWVTSEILPCIRKHGAYATPQAIERWKEDPETLIKVLAAYNDEKKANAILKEEVAIRDQQILEMQPKITYYDVVLDCKDLIEITKIAKDYGWSGAKMNNILHEKGIQYKTSDGQWLLYQKYAGQGYTATRTHVYTGTSGVERSRIHTYWTQKGRLFIYDLLKKDGIFPEIEREVVA